YGRNYSLDMLRDVTFAGISVVALQNIASAAYKTEIPICSRTFPNRQASSIDGVRFRVLLLPDRTGFDCSFL
ncbi:hypothetical protein, partial [uncultured Alistipes sp.]|uniref:hypothetical protein n=1 Tax=Bacteroides acidifaciens TaxID=85831 RepID=UPI00272BBFC4